MRITSTAADFIRPDQTRETQRSTDEGLAKKAASQPAAKVERSDKVEISEAARQLAATGGLAEGTSVRGDLTPERVAAIRENILKGAYNSVDVVDQVARKMLASGDI
ncbi:MAG: flagellar biosynthesis anti-sigma factor FlgM [Gemmatimonadetes bacterium]|nr:flagellar biosynthesis anti-sigma factor FlgM [Gemmatimonadota bacterium]